MTMLDELPGNVVALMKSVTLAEFATVSSAGVPIDTVSAVFPSQGTKTFDVATGLSYPAKAERVRKNPKAGLLLEGKPDEPVISIAGMGAVRDSDLQANAVRYISETCYTMPGNPDWSLARKAVWYWTRMLIEVTPARVLWWENPAAMDRPPQRWEAPAGTIFPTSDPVPPGALSSSSNWPQRPWQELADKGLARGAGAHLTVIDGAGYPLPIRARNIARTEDGFTMDMPKGLPWPLTGKATFSFLGLETFVGDVTTGNGLTALQVKRVLPTLPMVNDLKQLWEPTPETYASLMARLKHEMERRGLPIPTIPDAKLPPTDHYKIRLARRGITI